MQNQSVFVSGRGWVPAGLPTPHHLPAPTHLLVQHGLKQLDPQPSSQTRTQGTKAPLAEGAADHAARANHEKHGGVEGGLALHVALQQRAKAGAGAGWAGKWVSG